MGNVEAALKVIARQLAGENLAKEVADAYRSEQEKASECPECHRVMWHGPDCSMSGTVDVARKACDSSPKPTKRSCRNCKHEALLGGQPPCSGCFGNPTHPKWEPYKKPEPKPNWKVEAGAMVTIDGMERGMVLAVTGRFAWVWTEKDCQPITRFLSSLAVTKEAVPEVGDTVLAQVFDKSFTAIITNRKAHDAKWSVAYGSGFQASDGLKRDDFTIICKGG